jgi:hypothetical protein
MAQSGENVRCLILDEFVDDASARPKESRPPEKGAKAESLKELVHRIASEMGVPQFHLGEVVDKVLSAMGPQIEECIRKELQGLMDRQGSGKSDGFTA